MPSPLAAAALLLAALLVPGAAGAGAADDPAAALPGPAALAPLERQAFERHTPETLWERIDGEAELFKTYGLTASAHARYQDPAGEDRRVEVSVFALADPLGAFGLFAAFRPESCAAPRPLGNGACLDDLQGILWHGARFVLVDAAGPDATRAADLRRALEAVAAACGPAPALPGTLSAFARVAEPLLIRWQPQHLLGRDELPAGLEGVAGGTAVFRSTGALAQPGAALEAYAATLEGALRREHAGLRVVSGRDPMLGPVTLAVAGGRIVGARAAAGDPGVLELVARLAALEETPAGDGTR